MTPNPQNLNGSGLNGSNGVHPYGMNGASNGVNGQNGQAFVEPGPEFQAFEEAFIHDKGADIAQKYVKRIDYTNDVSIKKSLIAISADVRREVVKNIRELSESESYKGIFEDVNLSSRRLIDGITEKVLYRAAEIKGLKSAERKISDEVLAYGTGPKEKEIFVRNLKPGRKNEAPKTPGKLSSLWSKVKNKFAKADYTDQASRAEKLSIKDDEAGLLNGSKQETAETVKQMETRMKEKAGELKALEKEVVDQKKALKEIESELEKTAKVLKEFQTMTRIHQEEQTLGNSVRKSFWGDEKSQYYRKGFELQAEIEQKIIGLLRAAQLTQARQGVVADVNDTSILTQDSDDVENGTLFMFTKRQKQLEVRLAGLKAVIEETDEQASRTGKQIKESIKKTAELKNWVGKSVKERTEVFWAEFGNDITLIRQWQEMLPTVSRGGNVNRLTHITAIDTKYRKLRERVMAFESEMRVSGMMDMLNKELGTYRINGSIKNPRREEAQERLESVQQELALAKEQKLEGALIKYAYTGTMLQQDDQRNGHDAKNIANDINNQPGAPDAAPDLSDPAKQGTISLDAAQNQPSVVASSAASNAAASQTPATAPDQPAVTATVDTTKATVDPEAATNQPPVSVKLLRQIEVGPISRFIGVNFDGSELVYNHSYDLSAKKTFRADAPKTNLGYSYNPDLTGSEIVDATTGLIKIALNGKETKESVEIPRNKEVLFIGDLNGNMEIFAKSLVSLKLSKEPKKKDFSDLSWIGGNRRLILLGDILADRHMGGLAIINAINTLRKEAVTEKGNIITMYGNHEDFALSFLVGKNYAGSRSLISPNSRHGVLFMSTEGDQGRGIFEFIRKFSKKGRDFQGDMDLFVRGMKDEITHPTGETLKDADKLGAEVLDNMRNDEEGRNVLENIANMKLIHLDWPDTLVLHTEPTLEILDYILDGVNTKQEFRKVVSGVNNEFKDLVKKLFAGIADESERMMALERLSEMTTLFANTRNRNFSYEEKKDKVASRLDQLKTLGITRIVHGHTHADVAPSRKTANGLDIVNLDKQAGHPNGSMDERSIAYIGLDQKIYEGKDEAEKIDYHVLHTPEVEAVAEWLTVVYPLANPSMKFAKRVSDALKANGKKPLEAANRLIKIDDLNAVLAFMTGKSNKVGQISRAATLRLDSEALLEARKLVARCLREENLTVEETCKVILIANRSPLKLADRLNQMTDFGEIRLKDILSNEAAKAEQKQQKPAGSTKPVQGVQAKPAAVKPAETQAQATANGAAQAPAAEPTPEKPVDTVAAPAKVETTPVATPEKSVEPVEPAAKKAATAKTNGAAKAKAAEPTSTEKTEDKEAEEAKWREMLEKVFGLKDIRREMMIVALGNMKSKEPANFKRLMEVIKEHVEAVGFLFTGKYKNVQINGGIKLLDFSRKLATEDPAVSLLKVCGNADRLTKFEEKVAENGGDAGEQTKLEDYIRTNFKGSLSTMLNSFGKA